MLHIWYTRDKASVASLDYGWPTSSLRSFSPQSMIGSKIRLARSETGVGVHTFLMSLLIHLIV